MITVQEAIDIIISRIKDFGTEQIPLDQAMGRSLQEDLVADRDFPPYHRVTMDGIAINYEGFEQGLRQFSIQGVAAAGAPQMALRDHQSCFEVMTGSILPENTDTVIRYEDLLIEDGLARIEVPSVKKGQNVHYKGEDRLAGSVVVRKGRRLSPAEIGVAATIGKNVIKVSKNPSAIVISTGDELVEIHEKPLPHQIRRSNVHRLQATLSSLGLPTETHHLNDDMEEILRKLSEFIDRFDVLILSGGVSKGKFDFLPEALSKLGVKKYFHKIKQRPGKPFWFGEAPNGTLVFALPGNPVSSFLCTHRYFIPWLEKSLGLPNGDQPTAILQKDYHFKPDLTYFLQVKVGHSVEGQLLATPVEGHGSGDLANLVDADAFLQLPRGRDDFHAGETYPLFFYR